MAILEKEVWVGLTSRNINHYESLGYEIPRKKDKNYKLTVPRGTIILVRVTDLSVGSNVELTKICDECGEKSPNQPYYSILNSRKSGDGKDRCFGCSTIQGGLTQKRNVKYENSLESFAKENNLNHLLKEFSDKNEKLPYEISYGTNDIYWWNCLDCKSEYDISVKQRTTGCNCPYCSGDRVNHTNCLWTTHPEVAGLLFDLKDGYKYTKGSHQKLEFKCPECGFKQRKMISNVVKNGLFSCTRCGDGLRYPEKFMFNILEQINIYFETQKIFSWSDNKRYDFYVPSKNNLIIETHGLQHYTHTGFSRTLEEEIKNDEYKMKLAKNQSFQYIIIDCRESNLEYIKNSILNSTLKELFNLDNLNWHTAHEFAFKSNLVKTACGMWNDGIKSVVEIGKIMKLGRNAIVKYLKLGTELSWCNYDPIEASKKSASINGKNTAKQIVQLTKEGMYIKTWKSTHEAANELGISQGNISSVCTSKRNHTGGYKWMYKEDYVKKN